MGKRRVKVVGIVIFGGYEKVFFRFLRIGSIIVKRIEVEFFRISF